jgi:galactofuranose transport system permease protein
MPLARSALVIMPGGIDLSVGGTAAMSSVVAALTSPYNWAAGLGAGMAAGLAVGIINGVVITRLKIQPFIATLAAMPAAYGTGLLVAGNQSVSVSYDSGFTEIGQGDFFGFPTTAWIALAVYICGWIALERHPAATFSPSATARQPPS